MKRTVCLVFLLSALVSCRERIDERASAGVPGAEPKQCCKAVEYVHYASGRHDAATECRLSLNDDFSYRYAVYRVETRRLLDCEYGVWRFSPDVGLELLSDGRVRFTGSLDRASATLVLWNEHRQMLVFICR